MNFTSNIKILDLTLCTMMRLTLIHLMQMTSLLTFQSQLGGEEVTIFYFFTLTLTKINILPQVKGDNWFVNQGDNTSLKDQFENVVGTRGSTSFDSTIWQENYFVIPLTLPHSHLGDEDITNISSVVLTESQG